MRKHALLTIAFIVGLAIAARVKVETQQQMLVNGVSSSTGATQAVKSTSNALWVALQSIGGVTCIGKCAPVLVANNRITAQSSVGTTITSYANPATDGTFEIVETITVTAAGSTASFTGICTYTDEGNTSRTLTLDWAIPGSVFPSTITTAQGAVQYAGTVRQIRVKASTTITLTTAGTIGGATFNGEGTIKQVA